MSTIRDLLQVVFELSQQGAAALARIAELEQQLKEAQAALTSLQATEE